MGVADNLVAAMQPWIKQGPDLEGFLRAYASMGAQVELYACDQDDGTPGWAIIFDPDRCPLEALPYAAQYVGEILPLGISEEKARQWLKDSPNYQRGTQRSIARAAQRSLTGSGTVMILERIMPDGTPDPDGDNFTVITYTSETPRPDQVWEDLQDVILDDMLCNYIVSDGATWLELEVGSPSWATLEATYSTCGDMHGATPGASVWTR